MVNIYDLSNLYDPTYYGRRADMLDQTREEFDLMKKGANNTSEKQMMLEALANLYSTAGGVQKRALPDASPFTGFLDQKQDRLDRISGAEINQMNTLFEDETEFLAKDYQFKKQEEEFDFRKEKYADEKSRQEKIDERNRYDLVILEDAEGNPFYGYYDQDTKKFMKDGVEIEGAKPYYKGSTSKSTVDSIKVYDPTTDTVAFATVDEKGVIRDASGQIRSDLQPIDAWEDRQKKTKEDNNLTVGDYKLPEGTPDVDKRQFAKSISTFNNLEKAIDRYEEVLRTEGVNSDILGIISGRKDVANASESKVRNAYSAVMMQLKELYGLGALQEADIKVMQEQLSDPTSSLAGLTDWGDIDEDSPFLAQIDGVRETLRTYKDQLMAGSGAQPMNSNSTGGGSGPVLVGTDGTYDYYEDPTTGKKYRVKK